MYSYVGFVKTSVVLAASKRVGNPLTVMNKRKTDVTKWVISKQVM